MFIELTFLNTISKKVVWNYPRAFIWDDV